MGVTYKINQPYWHEARVKDIDISLNIMAQLKTNFVVFASWGSHKFINMGDGLKFNVKGRKFKGQVIIKLNADDTYTMLFGKIVNSEWILKEVYEGVYNDQLHELINEYVER